MITTLWSLGLILFTLSLIFMAISDECEYRNKSKYEKWSLAFILTAVTLFGVAMSNTSQEEKTVTQVFDQQTLDKSTFKWQNLAGKELTIHVGQYPDELGKGTHVCVIGVDKTDGKCYVLHTGIGRGE